MNKNLTFHKIIFFKHLIRIFQNLMSFDRFKSFKILINFFTPIHFMNLKNNLDNINPMIPKQNLNIMNPLNHLTLVDHWIIWDMLGLSLKLLESSEVRSFSNPISPINPKDCLNLMSHLQPMSSLQPMSLIYPMSSLQPTRSLKHQDPINHLSSINPLNFWNFLETLPFLKLNILRLQTSFCIETNWTSFDKLK